MPRRGRGEKESRKETGTGLTQKRIKREGFAHGNPRGSISRVQSTVPSDTKKEERALDMCHCLQISVPMSSTNGN